jgi:3-hydroxyisobutyrate dehydrogenase-like beta-hydroxyacid dehydrogenase
VRPRSSARPRRPHSTLFTAPIHKTYGGIVARAEWNAKGGFGLPLGLKDVRLVLQTADSAGVPMPTASLLHDQLATAMGRGMNELDWSALGRLVAENAGLA